MNLRRIHKLRAKLLHPIREKLPQQVWLAVHVGGWLCLLPILLRTRSLTHLLQRIGEPSGDQKRGRLEIELILQVVLRLCKLPLFRLPLFPRSCLLQSLALYYGLTREGYPARIHFGIRKEEGELLGHSWVTLQGKPVAERIRIGAFSPAYSYPSGSFPFNLDETSNLSRGGQSVYRWET